MQYRDNLEHFWSQDLTGLFVLVSVVATWLNHLNLDLCSSLPLFIALYKTNAKNTKLS